MAISSRSQQKIFFRADCPHCQSSVIFAEDVLEVTCAKCKRSWRADQLTVVERYKREDVPKQVEQSEEKDVVDVQLTPSPTTTSIDGPICTQEQIAQIFYLHCKLISPLLTQYVLEENEKTGRFMGLSLRAEGQPLNFRNYSDRAFMLEVGLAMKPEFGVDASGGLDYLSHTLTAIRNFNGNLPNLLPVHTFGDGNCLVHALSKAIMGLELLSIPLRHAMKEDLTRNLDRYRDLCKEFFPDISFWEETIRECEPGYVCRDGEGLTNVHIFVLSNVLRRPIILLDAMQGMQCSGDCAAVFLPVLHPVDECKGRSGQLNSPLCVAWSNPGHNHFVALVGVAKYAPPLIPKSLLPPVWCVDAKKLDEYVRFEGTPDQDWVCAVGTGRPFSPNFVVESVAALDAIYTDIFRVHPQLVEDCCNQAMNDSGVVMDPTKIRHLSVQAVSSGRLYRCLFCLNMWWNRGPIPKRCARCNKHNTYRQQKADGSVAYLASDFTGTSGERQLKPTVFSVTRLTHWCSRRFLADLAKGNFCKKKKPSCTGWFEDAQEKPPVTGVSVRVALSDQRSADVKFKDSMDYGQLNDAIMAAFQDTFEILRILHGFPPKEILRDAKPLPIRAGDKLVVIIAKKQSEIANDDITVPIASPDPVVIPSILPNAGSNPLQLQLATVRSAAKKANLDFCAYCLQNPNLFCKGGVLYEFALSFTRAFVPDQIYILSFLPEIKFRYDQSKNQLNLVVESPQKRVVGVPEDTKPVINGNLWSGLVNGSAHQVQFDQADLNDLASEMDSDIEEEECEHVAAATPTTKRNCELTSDSSSKVKSKPVLPDS